MPSLSFLLSEKNYGIARRLGEREEREKLFAEIFYLFQNIILSLCIRVHSQWQAHSISTALHIFKRVHKLCQEGATILS